MTATPPNENSNPEDHDAAAQGDASARGDAPQHGAVPPTGPAEQGGADRSGGAPQQPGQPQWNAPHPGQPTGGQPGWGQQQQPGQTPWNGQPQFGQQVPGAGQPGPSGAGYGPRDDFRPNYGASGPGQDWGGQQNPYWTPPQPMSPADQRLWSTLTHISGIFFNFVAPLVAYFVLRDRGDFVRDHTRQTLNFSLTMLIGYAIGGITSFLGIGVLIALAAWILTIVFGIQAAVAANQGRFYKYPLAIEFFKN
jgi:uncharacterized protein